MNPQIIVALFITVISFGSAWTILNSAKRMERSFSRYVRFTSKVYGRERAKVNSFFIDANNGAPSMLSMFSYANNSTSAVFSSKPTILSILNLCSLSKIAYSIVGLVPINMVNKFGGPLPKFIKPSKSMCVVVNLVDHYYDIAIDGKLPSFRPNLVTSGCRDSSEVPSISVIPQCRFKSVSGKGRIENAHAVRPYNDGLGSDAYGLIHRGHCAF